MCCVYALVDAVLCCRGRVCQSPSGIVACSVPVAAAAGDAAAAVVVVICCSSLAAESIESDCPPRPADKVVAATARPTVTAVIE